MARTDRMVREFTAEAEWVPFELHPEIPAQGYEQDERRPLMKPEVREYLASEAQQAGLLFKGNPLIANSHNALAASEWARDQGSDAYDKLHHAIFTAYFGEARNISTVDQVVAIAGEQGLDGADLRVHLGRGAYSEAVTASTARMREHGITSTPTFLFDDRYMMMGAQDFETFASVLGRLGVPRRD